jgi:hypothetical protein
MIPWLAVSLIFLPPLDNFDARYLQFNQYVFRVAARMLTIIVDLALAPSTHRNNAVFVGFCQ